MSWEFVFNGTEQIGVVCKQYKFEEIAWVRDIVHVNQKKKWPNMEPCGTPVVRVRTDDFILSISTYIERLDK